MKKYIRHKTLILFGIVLIAAFFRLFSLSTNPPSLTWDEVSWGYNAYSLGIDGRDEFGKFLPITYLESFGDFKPPLYAYLDILPVKILGMSELAVRLPSAFAGILTVALTYLLVVQIFGREKEKEAFVAAFIVAISPWHIMLSRAAFEANVSTALIVLGLYLFLKSKNDKIILLPFSVVSFVASLYTFNSARVIVPIIVIVLAIVFYRFLLKNLVIACVSALLGFLLFLPLFIFLQSPQAKLRFDEVNIFSDINVINRTNQEIANDDNSAFSKVIHNRRFAYGVEYLGHYFDNLTPKFLFFSGDGNPKFSIQDVGQVYLWEAPFLLLGVLLLFRQRRKYWWIVPFMIVVAIVPAGFARETPHALRTESVVPFLQIVTAIGVCAFIDWFRGKIQIFSKVCLTLVIFISLMYFAHNLFFHYPKEYSGEWQYGYKESLEYVKGQQNNYQKVYITEALGRPYVYALFYLKYSPQKFRQEANIYREALGFVHVRSFSNIYFEEEIEKVNTQNSLYLAQPDSVPVSGKILKEFKLLNGKTILVAYSL